MSGLESRRGGPQVLLQTFLKDEGHAPDIFSGKDIADLLNDTKAFLQYIRSSKITAAVALSTSLIAITPANAQEQIHITQAQHKTIDILLHEFDKEIQRGQIASQEQDAIEILLKRIDKVGAREFMERRYNVKLEEHTPLVQQSEAMRCMVQNAFREAGSKKEIDGDGHFLNVFAGLARAFDPLKRFPHLHICGVVQQDRQFSWTFDPRILDRTPTKGDEVTYDMLSRIFMQEFGDMTPHQVLIHLSKRLELPLDAFFYRRDDMYGEYIDTRGVRTHIGTPPVQRPGETAEQFERRRAFLRMSPGQVRIWARMEPSRRLYGSHRAFRMPGSIPPQR